MTPSATRLVYVYGVPEPTPKADPLAFEYPASTPLLAAVSALGRATHLSQAGEIATVVQALLAQGADPGEPGTSRRVRLPSEYQGRSPPFMEISEAPLDLVCAYMSEAVLFHQDQALHHLVVMAEALVQAGAPVSSMAQTRTLKAFTEAYHATRAHQAGVPMTPILMPWMCTIQLQPGGWTHPFTRTWMLDGTSAWSVGDTPDPDGALPNFTLEWLIPNLAERAQARREALGLHHTLSPDVPATPSRLRL